MSFFEAIVVGGGIVGATTAAMLSERGVEVALIDAGACAGRGASAFSGGIVRLYDPDPAMLALGAHALAVRRRTRAGRIFSQAIRTTGVLYRVAEASAEAVETAMAPFRDEGYPSAFLEPGQLAAICPFARPCPGKADLFEPEGGHSDVRFATHSMAHVVRETGTVLEHCPVQSVGRAENGLAELRLAAGGTIRSRIVVVAAGAWTARLLPDLPVTARSIPLGLIALGAPLEMPVIDIPSGTYAVPFGMGVIGVGCGLRSAGTVPEDLDRPGPAHEGNSLNQLAAMAGARDGAQPLGVLAGFDSYTPDGRPLFGFLGPDSPVYAIAGLNGIGFKIAPAIADLAAEDIRTRLRGDAPSSPALASNFRPDRFAPPAGQTSRRTMSW